jgi:hypothetical protein
MADVAIVAGVAASAVTVKNDLRNHVGESGLDARHHRRWPSPTTSA